MLDSQTDTPSSDVSPSACWISPTVPKSPPSPRAGEGARCVPPWASCSSNLMPGSADRSPASPRLLNHPDASLSLPDLPPCLHLLHLPPFPPPNEWDHGLASGMFLPLSLALTLLVDPFSLKHSHHPPVETAFLSCVEWGQWLHQPVPHRPSL